MTDEELTEQIECKNLSVGHEGKAVAENINFTVHTGDYVCIIGENGSGKTTLMSTLSGLIQPVSGYVVFSDDCKKNIGYLPQKTPVQKDFPASVYEVVISGAKSKKIISPFHTGKEKENAEKMMSLLGIEHLARESFRTLSGGQQQRVLLARALCAEPDILLLDEPIAGLDPIAASEMYFLLALLNREHKMTVIMISHDLLPALSYASHVLYIGRETYYGTIDEFRHSKFKDKLNNTGFGIKNGEEGDGNA